MLSRKIIPSDADSYSVNKQRKQIQLLSHSLKVFLGNEAVKPMMYILQARTHDSCRVATTTLERVCLVTK